MKNSSIELSDVVNKFGGEYIEQFGSCMLPSHRRALNDIADCMTPEMGGKRHRCKNCDETFWKYHGCRNRSCPKCHRQQTADWLDARSMEMLPCDYFHVVSTVPSELRPLFLRHQKVLYGLLMKVSADAVRELAAEPRFVGAMVGVLAVLQTWTGRLHIHPHVHMLVTGGGVTADGSTWKDASSKFLFPVKRLSPLISLRFAEALEKNHQELFTQIPKKVWKREWCSFCKPFGKGKEAILNYLARYVFKIAISNARILSIDESHVTFKYKNNDTNTWATERVPGVDFIRRFLLHVLPRGFHKVRYYGLWHSSKRELQAMARLLFVVSRPVNTENEIMPIIDLAEEKHDQCDADKNVYEVKCPACGSTDVILIGTLRRREVSWGI